MAVVVGSRPGPRRSPGRWAEFGIVLVGPPYRAHTVVRGSPADRAGIKPGDLLVEVNGRRPETLGPERLIDSLQLRTGQPVTMRVRRGAGIVTAIVRAPSKSMPAPVKQVGLTYARGALLLTLTQYPASQGIRISPGSGGQMLRVSGSSALLTHPKRGARLRWTYRGLNFDLSAAEGGFTDAELLACARSIR